MSAYLYDEALIAELRKVTNDDRIHIVDPNLAISFLAQFDKDKVKFPAIVLSRNSINLTESENQVAKLKGETARINEENNTAEKAKLIPIRIQWSIDVFAVDRFTCDEIIRELIFYFKTHARFYVEVPYNLNIKQNFDIFVDDEIADNSDLVEFPNTGEYFRETITIYTENAHLYSSGQVYLGNVTADVEDRNY